MPGRDVPVTRPRGRPRHGAQARVNLSLRVEPDDLARLQALADVETDGNLTALVLRLVAEARAAREALTGPCLDVDP